MGTFEVTQVERLGEAVANLATHAVDIVLLDLGLPDALGLDTVRRAHAAAPNVPLVVLTGSTDRAMAVLALQEGAQDPQSLNTNNPKLNRGIYSIQLVSQLLRRAELIFIDHP